MLTKGVASTSRCQGFRVNVYVIDTVSSLDGKYTQTPLKIHKIHSVFDLEANTQIHQGGVFSPPSSKYTKYTVYLGSGGNTLNTYFPSRIGMCMRSRSVEDVSVLCRCVHII